MKQLKGIILGISACVLATALALIVLLSCDALYISDMKALDIPETSGYAEDVVLRNYRAVVRWLLPFNGEEFSMPDFAFSESGKQHFDETKNIINGFYAAGAACALLIVIILLRTRRDAKGACALRWAAVSSLAFPALILGACAVNFDRFFLLFHKLFFNNDYWIFDYRTDPVILILPEEFFLHCVLVVGLFWLLAAALLFISAARIKAKAA